MKKVNSKKEKRERRKKRIRAKIFGTPQKPRLSVFKSNRYISAQLIDDQSGKTLASSHSKTIRSKTLMEKSKTVGLDLAEKAKTHKFKEIVFDRGGFSYTGCIKALADGAREGGLKF